LVYSITKEFTVEFTIVLISVARSPVKKLPQSIAKLGNAGAGAGGVVTAGKLSNSDRGGDAGPAKLTDPIGSTPDNTRESANPSNNQSKLRNRGITNFPGKANSRFPAALYLVITLLSGKWNKIDPKIRKINRMARY
jgi:hypothetical protein